MRNFLIAAALTLLTACTNYATNERAPVGAKDFDYFNACYAEYFNVEPLTSTPIINYMGASDLKREYNSWWGAAVTQPWGNLSYIFLATGMSRAEHDHVFGHEVVHIFQAFRLGMSMEDYDEAEEHAQQHDRACL